MQLRENIIKVLCVIMIVLTVLSSGPVSGFLTPDKSTSIVARASEATGGVAAKMDAFFQTVKGKDKGNYIYKRGKTTYASQCHGFANDLWYHVYGYDMYQDKSYTTKEQSTFTEKAIKTFILSNARIGDVLRATGPFTHSYTLRSITTEGITYYEYGGNKPYSAGAHEVTLTYQELTSRWINGNYRGRKPTKYFLFKINDDIYKQTDSTSNITFNANGGLLSTANGAVTTITKSYTFGKRFGKLPVPVNNDCFFDGWYTKRTGGKKITSKTKVNQSGITYYAHWINADFAVSYSGNHGTGKMADKYVEKNKTFQLDKNQFVRKGYVFSGWKVMRKSDRKWFIKGKGWKSSAYAAKHKDEKKLYSPEQSIKLNSSWWKGAKKNDTFIFFAVWEKCTHNWNRGRVTKSATTVSAGIKKYTCKICKKTKTVKIPALKTEKYFTKVYIDVKSGEPVLIGKTSKKVNMKKSGFYFGTDKKSLKKISKNLKGNKNAPKTTNRLRFTLSKWYGKLKPGKTYYYALYYVDKNGKECIGAINSYKAE